MTRIIVWMRPLCNRQPPARLSTPFSQPRRRQRQWRRRRRQRWRHEDDDTDEIYVRRSRSQRLAYHEVVERQAWFLSWFLLLSACNYGASIENNCHHAAVLAMIVMHEGFSCRRVLCSRNNFRCNFAQSIFSSSVCKLSHAICQHIKIYQFCLSLCEGNYNNLLKFVFFMFYNIFFNYNCKQ